MNGLADDFFTGDTVEGSSKAGERETWAKGAGPLPCDAPGGLAKPSGAFTPDLRWLGMMSCLGSALITIAGAALITGHLLSAGDGNMVAEDEGSPQGYVVAAGSDL